MNITLHWTWKIACAIVKWLYEIYLKDRPMRWIFLNCKPWCCAMRIFSVFFYHHVVVYLEMWFGFVQSCIHACVCVCVCVYMHVSGSMCICVCTCICVPYRFILLKIFTCLEQFRQFSLISKYYCDCVISTSNLLAIISHLWLT